MTSRGQEIDRRRVLRLMGAGLVTGAVAPWLASCSSDDGGGAAASSTTTTTAATTTTAPRPLGPLGEVDANGLRLPEGFTSRIVARSGEEVAGTGYAWHGNPDGGACFATDDGGWIYVSNCEELDTGGVSMVRFDAEGEIVEAASICEGTDVNCAGGATPWDTWLTCEEVAGGQVWETDPWGVEAAVARPAMGRFKHEAAAVDEAAEVVYLSEDEPDGALYRFTPSSWPDLSEGALHVLAGAEGSRRWAEVPDPSGTSGPTRNQVADVVRFAGGEGLAHFEGTTYLATKLDNRIWALDGEDVTVLYDGATTDVAEDGQPLLTGVDNICVDSRGDRYVAEDGGTMDVVRLAVDGTIEAVARVEGVEGSEITGPAFSPDGTRLYFSSQRSPGVTYEVTGPFPHAAQGPHK
ncbi:MAG TPA: alkaline phosphatase PhoX [Acidimicrobiales bacterium]|nr:alkaline phosphatase PhoX [Acidimicrobiales bacterium]